MQRDGDGDGAFSSQGGHGPLCLRLITRGFDPGATQVGQLVELHTVLLQDRWALWWWTCFCERTWRFLVFIFLLTRVSITAVSLACKNSREETTKTLRRSKDEKKVRKSDTGSCGVGGGSSLKGLNPELWNSANRKQNNASCSWTSTAEWLLCYIMQPNSSSLPLQLCSNTASESLAAWKMNETIRTKYGFMGLNIVLYV